MDISAVEIFGYCASATIAYSLTRNSIVKLRWINLFGASSFCVYGIIIEATPVALLNGFIAMTNVFYLRKLLLDKAHNFSVIKVNRPSNYIDFFLEYHHQEIEFYFPRFLNKAADKDREYFFLTERTEVVGMVSGYAQGDGSFIVDFDFVIPAYRDARLGQYIMGEGQRLTQQFNYRWVGARADSVEHEAYLERIGMSPQQRGIWRYLS